MVAKAAALPKPAPAIQPVHVAAAVTAPPVASAAPETALKKAGHSKSEWLVVLQPEAAPPPKAPASAPATAPGGTPNGNLRADHALSQREYEAYVARKRRDPDSNL